MITNRRLTIGASIAVVVCIAVFPFMHRRQGQPGAKAIKQILAASNARSNFNASLQNLPLSFERNEGQADTAVQYLARGGNFTLFLKPAEATLALPRRPSASFTLKKRPLSNTVDLLNLQLRGSNGDVEIKPLDPLIGKVNYLGKKYPHGGLTNISTFAKIEYENVYPGINLAYRGTQRQLEYDFIVAPGADPQAIRMHFSGAKSLHLDSAGDLLVKTAAEELIEHRPVIYQWGDKGREEIIGNYRLDAKKEVQFAVGRYDHSRALIIDPTIMYASFFSPLGSSNTDDDVTVTNGVTVDSMGEAYVTGSTGTNLNEGAANQACELTTGFVECGYAFVTKFNASGTATIYQTLIADASGKAIAVDSAGNVYVAGSAAPGFVATSSGFQQSSGGGTCTGGQSPPGTLSCSDAFVAVLDTIGSTTTYATYLGGNGNDSAAGVAVDSMGAIYITGQAGGTNFPTTSGAFQTSFNSANGAGATFVAKIDPTKTGAASLIYSTLIGGGEGSGSASGGNANEASDEDMGTGIGVDASGAAYVTGITYNSDLATSGAFQSTQPEAQSPYVAKLNSSGTSLEWATYLGGSNTSGCPGDVATGIAVDSSGNSYVTGQATTSDFPVTPGAFQARLNSSADAFVAKLNSTGTGLIYSTLLGGSVRGEIAGHTLTPQIRKAYLRGSLFHRLVRSYGNAATAASPGCLAQGAAAITIDSSGNAFITGFSDTGDFPIGNVSLKPMSSGEEPFIAEINPTGQSLIFSTYFFGQFLTGIALDGSGGIYVSGDGGDPNLANVPGIQSDSPIFAAKVDLDVPGPAVLLVPQSLSFGTVATGTSSPPQTAILKNVGNGPLDIANVTISGGVTQTNNCSASLSAGASCTFNVVNTGSPGQIAVTDNAADSPQVLSIFEGESNSLASLSASSLSFGNQAVGVTSAAQVITLASIGNANLDISSITASGDFAETNNCGTALAVSTTCQINVTFTPTSAASASGTLVVTDNSSNSATQKVALSGSGGSVPLTVTTNSSSETITAGQTATYMLQISAAAGFNGSATISCSGAPSGATCTGPSPITLSGTTPVTEKITVSTTAQSMLLPPGSYLHPKDRRLLVLAASFALAFIMSLFSLASVNNQRRAILLGVAAVVVCVSLAACGGSGGSGSNGTPSGTYTLNVTVTAGGGSKAIPLTLHVN